jgi:acyl-CoA synthetase (AMP-forming)/AMP-acid ligase II
LLLEHPLPDDEPLIYVDDGHVTLGAAKHAAAELATVLHEAGAEPGQPVAALVGGGPEPIITMIACWMVGAVYLPCNARFTDAELDHALTETPAAVLVLPPGSTRDPGRGVGLVTSAGELRWTVERPVPAAVPTFDRDVALIMRTSGTTGRPKPVLLRHAGTIESLDTMIGELRRSSASKTSPRSGPPPPNLIPLSLALWAGIYNTLFALRAGAPVVLLRKFSTTEVRDAIARFEIRSTVLAPAMITMLSDDAGITDLAPLRFVRSITAPLRKEEAERFYARFGVPVLNSYGQTELGGEVVGWTARDVREFGARKLGSAGRPHTGIDVAILTGAHEPVEPGAVGEVWVRSPFLMKGYADAAAELSERVVDGYLRTGDLGRIDEDGFLWIDGRVSDMINRGGLKVSPDEVEQVLRRHPGIVDACVAGIPDVRLGEVPFAWIIPGDGPLDADELTQWCRSALAPYKIPVGFEAVSEFPRSEVGKVLRRALVDGRPAS